jgi:hypothetical protein
MSFPYSLDAFDDIARLIMGAVFLSCFGAVWCYKTETSKTESSIIRNYLSSHWQYSLLLAQP